MLSDVIHCLSGGSTLPPLDGTFLQAPRERVIGFCFAMESAQRAGKSVIDLWRPTPAPCASRESCAKVNCSNGETWLSLDLKTRGKLDVRTNGAPILGSQGQSLVAHLTNSSGDWIARARDEDYGIDIEAELSSPAVTGQLLKIQVKASKSVEATDKGILCQIPRKLAAYADSCRLPVILVRVEIEKQQAWYLWVQDWVLEKRRAGLG